MDLDGQLGGGSTYGNTKLHSTGISSAFRTISTMMGDGEHAAILDIPELWNGLQGCDCHDYEIGQFLKPASRRPGVRHSTFESLRFGRSSQSIASDFLRFWDSQNFKKDREFVGITVLFLDEKVNSVIHGFTLVRRANHYKSSLKADSIVKGDRFEFLKPASRCPGVRHSTFESLRLGRSSQSIASDFLRFWDSQNFKKDREFVGITVHFLDEKIP
ncbi:hypothetical protein F2Q69_00033257 [Brassica cretica]|uniref:Uncharacterized protein n=1 Tax=Brassica cretica TaxID=69181 RepID=A0A8S9SDF4_BRACR|nr:hypothetical protein F2Q69_00033257 [Brassica cretica]